MKLTPFSDEKVLGVDLGTHSIKIVETRFSSGKPVALRAVCAEIDFSGASDPKGTWEAYVAALKRILSENKIKTKIAVIGIPNTAVGVEINWPPKTTNEPDEPPRENLEVETYSQSLEGTGAGGAHEKGTLRVTANRNTVIDKFEIARDAGLVPVVADVNIFAVVNVYMTAAEHAVKGLVFVLDIGANTTEIAVMHSDRVLAVRTVFLAGNNFTRGLQRELDVPLAAAEALKKKHGLLARVKDVKEDAPGGAETPEAKPVNKLAVKIAELLCGQADQFIAEIKRTVAYYAEATPGPEMRAAKVVLTGGSADLPGLAGYMGAELGVPVEIFRLSRLSDKPCAGLTSFAAAAGLSVRRWPRERLKLTTDINLLPRALIKPPGPAARIIVYALLAVLLGAGYSEYKVFTGRVRDGILKNNADSFALQTSLDRAKEAANRRKLEMTPAPLPAPVKPAPVKKYGYIQGLAVSGVFTDSSGASAYLEGSGRSFIVKAGKLYYEDGKVVAGITVTITRKYIVLTGGNERYELRIPE